MICPRYERSPFSSFVIPVVLSVSETKEKPALAQARSAEQDRARSSRRVPFDLGRHPGARLAIVAEKSRIPPEPSHAHTDTRPARSTAARRTQYRRLETHLCLRATYRGFFSCSDSLRTIFFVTNHSSGDQANYRSLTIELDPMYLIEKDNDNESRGGS